MMHASITSNEFCAMVPMAHTKSMIRMSECKRIHRIFGATDTRVVAEGL